MDSILVHSSWVYIWARPWSLFWAQVEKLSWRRLQPNFIDLGSIVWRELSWAPNIKPLALIWKNPLIPLIEIGEVWDEPTIEPQCKRGVTNFKYEHRLDSANPTCATLAQGPTGPSSNSPSDYNLLRTYKVRAHSHLTTRTSWSKWRVNYHFHLRKLNRDACRQDGGRMKKLTLPPQILWRCGVAAKIVAQWFVFHEIRGIEDFKDFGAEVQPSMACWASIFLILGKLSSCQGTSASWLSFGNDYPVICEASMRLNSGMHQHSNSLTNLLVEELCWQIYFYRNSSVWGSQSSWRRIENVMLWREITHRPLKKLLHCS